MHKYLLSLILLTCVSFAATNTISVKTAADITNIVTSTIPIYNSTNAARGCWFAAVDGVVDMSLTNSYNEFNSFSSPFGFNLNYGTGFPTNNFTNSIPGYFLISYSSSFVCAATNTLRTYVTANNSGIVPSYVAITPNSTNINNIANSFVYYLAAGSYINLTFWLDTETNNVTVYTATLTSTKID